jgi:hypothetical protein
MQETLRNSIAKFIQMEVFEIKKVQVKRTVFKTYYKINEKCSEETLKKVHETIRDFQPYQSNFDNNRVFNEIRRLLISDVPIFAKI